MIGVLRLRAQPFAGPPPTGHSRMVGNPSFTGLRKVCSLLGTHVHSPCVNVHQQLIGAIPHLGGQSCRDTSKMNCGHYAERLRVDR